MREAMFIKKNAAKWTEYQTVPAGDADEMAERFTNIIDDLSYAKTFYPRSKATRWLNGLAASIYQNVYQNKKEKYSRIFTFWKYEIPLLFYRYHKVLLFTFLTFALFIAIGAFASYKDPQVIREILGDRYVNMTETNIKNGDPFGVYRDDSKFAMFMRIAFNNVRVAITTFLSGFTLGIFTLYLLWNNGIMIGAFEQMFFAHGMGWQSIMTIWIHGTIEIASIIIAGTAGFILANGLLFPGTYSRGESLKRKGKDAGKIMIALIPFIVVAAVLESYVTYLMSSTFDNESNLSLPIWAGGIILALSLLLMVFYFVLWPIYLNKKGFYLVKGGVANRIAEKNA